MWNPATAKLLSAVEPIDNQIRLERALDGLSVPLHAGAARFYREAGLPVNNTPALPIDTQESDSGTKEIAQYGRGKDIRSEAGAANPKEP